MLRYRSDRCPYCGESQRLEIDLGEGLPQEFIWDCSVCCRPIRVTVSGDGQGGIRMRLRAEDDLG